MAKQSKQCPLCGWDAELARVPDRDAYEVRCGRCGRFIVTGVLLASDVTGADKSLLPYLSAHTRQATERGTVIELATDTWRDMARSHQGAPVGQKALAVLEHLASRSRWPGDKVEFFYETSAPLFDAATADEVGYFVEHLVRLKQARSMALLSGGRELIVEPEGWARLDDVVRQEPGLRLRRWHQASRD